MSKLREKKVKADGLEFTITSFGPISDKMVDQVVRDSLPELKRMMIKAAKKQRKKKKKDHSLADTLEALGITKKETK